MSIDASTYGPHGEQVAEFLAEAAAATPDDWRRFAEQDVPSRAQMAATKALTKAPLPAAVRSAVHGSSQEVGWALTVTEDDLPDGYAPGNIGPRIQAAAMALAAGEKLDAEHRDALLAPFARSGFRSAVGR